MKITNIILFSGLCCWVSLRGGESGSFKRLEQVTVHDWSPQALRQDGPNCTLYSFHNGMQFFRARKEATLPLAEDLLSLDQSKVNDFRLQALAFRYQRGYSIRGAEVGGISLDSRKGLANEDGLEPKDFTDIYPFINDKSYITLRGNCLDDTVKLQRAIDAYRRHDYTNGSFAHLFFPTVLFGADPRPHAVACVSSSQQPGELTLDYVDSSVLGSSEEIQKITRYIIAALSTDPNQLTEAHLREQSDITARITDTRPPLLPSKDKSIWNRLLNWCRNFIGLPVRYGKLSSFGDRDREDDCGTKFIRVLGGGAIILWTYVLFGPEPGRPSSSRPQR